MPFYSPKRAIAMQYFMIDANMTYTKTGDGYYGTFKSTNTNATGERYAIQSIRPFAQNAFTIYMRLNKMTATVANMEQIFIIYTTSGLGTQISPMFQMGVKNGAYHIWAFSPQGGENYTRANPLIIPFEEDINIYFSSSSMNKFYVNDVEFIGNNFTETWATFPQLCMENHYSSTTGTIEINISDLSYDTIAFDITQKSVRDDIRERSLISKLEISSVEPMDANITLTNETGDNAGKWTISNNVVGTSRWGQLAANSIGEHYTAFHKINSFLASKKNTEYNFGWELLNGTTRALLVVTEQDDFYRVNRYIDQSYNQQTIVNIPRTEGLEIIYSTYNRNKVYINNISYNIPFLPTAGFASNRTYVGFVMNEVGKVKTDITANCYFKRELNLELEKNRELVRNTVYRNQENPRPEIGYNRFDEIDTRLNYIGPWLTNADIAHYGGNLKYSDSLTGGSQITFKFKGTGIRLLANHNTTRASNSIINIDNGAIIKKFMQNDSVYGKRFSILIDGLSNTEHTAIITSGTDGTAASLTIDAIDIKGKLLHPYLIERDSIDDLEVGDVISCDYEDANTFFGNIGKGTKTLIKPTSTNTDGSLYFIKAANGLLIADRCVKENLSWDTLASKSFTDGASWQIDKSKFKTYVATAEIANTATYTVSGNVITASKTTPADANWSEAGFKSGLFQDTTNRTTGYMKTYFIFKKPTITGSSTAHLNIKAGFLNSDLSFVLKADGIYVQDAIGETKVGNYISPKRNVLLVETDFARGTSDFILNGVLYKNRVHTNLWSWTGDTVYWVVHPVGTETISLTLPRFTVHLTQMKTDLQFLHDSILGMPSGGNAYETIDNLPTITDSTIPLGAFPILNEWDRYINNNNFDGKITSMDERILNLDSKIHFTNSTPRTGLGRDFDTTTSTDLMFVCRNLDKFGNKDSKGMSYYLKTYANASLGYRPIIKYIDNKLPSNKKPKTLWY